MQSPDAPTSREKSGLVQQSALRCEGQPFTARVLQCAQARPLAIAQPTALGGLSPRQPLPAQFIRVLVAFAGLDDMGLRCHATGSRAMPLSPAGGVVSRSYPRSFLIADSPSGAFPCTDMGLVGLKIPGQASLK